jgi:hypothetical protein
MHCVEVQWQMGDLWDLATITAAAKIPVLETQQPKQVEVPLFALDRIKQRVSPLRSQMDAKAQRKPLLSCTCQPTHQINPKIT